MDIIQALLHLRQPDEEWPEDGLILNYCSTKETYGDLLQCQQYVSAKRLQKRQPSHIHVTSEVISGSAKLCVAPTWCWLCAQNPQEFDSEMLQY